jgi:hypothetical protein
MDQAIQGHIFMQLLAWLFWYFKAALPLNFGAGQAEKSVKASGVPANFISAAVDREGP